MSRNYEYLHVLGFISKVIRKIKMPKKLCQIYNNKYHSLVQMYLNPYFKCIYKNLKLNNYSLSTKPSDGRKIIWIFWWQGVDHAPLIVQRCIRSIINNSNRYKVIILNKENIYKYAQIPFYIYKRLRNNEMSITHFSDVLRFNLLRLYGGLWVDSTIYCTSKINNIGPIYTSGGYNNKYNFFISAKWTEFLIGGCKNNPIFIFMDEFFKKYWKHNYYITNYFMADFALNYIYMNNIGDFTKYVDNKASKNNPHLHDLQKLLNVNFNSILYKILTSDTNLFKLTYKKKLKNNGISFYSKIINS